MTDERPAIKHCPRCMFGNLIERVNSKTGVHFLGCDSYPNCPHTEPLPAYLVMQRSGAEPLPGMEGG